MEVDTQVGPLTLARFRHVVNRADVEWHELVLINRHKNSVIVGVDVEATSLQVRRELLDRRVRLDSSHVLHLLLLRAEGNLPVIVSLSQLFEFLLKQCCLTSLQLMLYLHSLVAFLFALAKARSSWQDDVC